MLDIEVIGKPASVVFDRDDELVADMLDVHGDCRRLRMLDCVLQQL